jgi:hypothetical protein
MSEADQTLEVERESRSRNTNRWGIAAAGFLMQMALGAAYAWSVFRVPLAQRFHWSIEEVTSTFTIANFSLGVSAFFGGLWLNKKGPRVVALTGGFLNGLGVFLAAFSANGLWWLYLSYGLIGGIGVGLCYIVPVAVLVKQFPESQGTYYRDCRGRIRRWGSDNRTASHISDSECGCSQDIHLSRYRIPGSYDEFRKSNVQSAHHCQVLSAPGHGLLYAEPARRMETNGLDTQRYIRGNKKRRD